MKFYEAYRIGNSEETKFDESDTFYVDLNREDRRKLADFFFKLLYENGPFIKIKSSEINNHFFTIIAEYNDGKTRCYCLNFSKQ